MAQIDGRSRGGEVSGYEQLRDSRDKTYRRWADELKKLRAMPRVFKSREIPIKGGPQFWIQYLHDASPEGVPLKSLMVLIEYYAPGAKSQIHGHQNEAIFYILEGRGYEVHDGVRRDFEAGDVVIVPPGTVHQHCNADPDHPVKAIAINPKSVYMYLNLIQQRIVEHPPHEGVADWRPPGILFSSSPLPEGGEGERGMLAGEGEEA
jgi:quercetin dioxygenase-like cupin family protein